MVALPSDVSVPLSVCVVALLNGGGVLRGPLSLCCLGPLCGVSCLRVVLFSLHHPPFGVFAVTALLVWGGVFVIGMCHCVVAVMVCVVVHVMAACVMSCHVVLYC